MTRLRLITGIDLPLEPSCGSTIWASDVYQRLSPNFQATFLALPGSGTWQHDFEQTLTLTATKAPYGPQFDTYAAELTCEVTEILRARRQVDDAACGVGGFPSEVAQGVRSGGEVRGDEHGVAAVVAAKRLLDLHRILVTPIPGSPARTMEQLHARTTPRKPVADSY
jgi:hypothetical protein